MKKVTAYISGLFEDKDNPLFLHIQTSLEKFEVSCHGVTLYDGGLFGSYSFLKEVVRVKKVIELLKPDIIIAHSLGAYVIMHELSHYSAIFLDPSLEISKMTIPVSGPVKISSEFTRSLKKMPSIEELAGRTGLRDVHVIGAGLGGFAVAERYHSCLPDSEYLFLADADHNFSNEKDRLTITRVIKERLGL